MTRRQAFGGSGLLALVLLVLLQGCATGLGRERSTAAQAPRSDRRGAQEAWGGAGDFSEPRVDAFQVAQEASGLSEEARHPVGAALHPHQARALLEHLARAPAALNQFAPRRVLAWLLSEVLAGGERVEYEDLRWRAERFERLVLVRPDGYLVAALSGTPLQRQGPLQLVEGQWRVGLLAVGDFYFSSGGVFYPVTAALRLTAGPPLAELSLGRDPLNAALDGAQDAFGELAVALAQSTLHPIRAVEDLTHLPTAVALLIASSPEYFARYGTMSREDQIREAARLSTHILMMLGGAEAAAGRISGLGAELPVVSLTARGEMVLGGVGVAAGVDVSALSVLHMAAKRPRPTGGGTAGKPPQAAAPQAPGKWVYKKPTNHSQDALNYQEQVTGRPAWWVYVIGELEFDGFKVRELLEAKGPGYCAFFNADGTPKYWYRASGKFDEMMTQAQKQSELAQQLKLPVTWHVADAKVAEYLVEAFKTRNITNITVISTPLER